MLVAPAVVPTPRVAASALRVMCVVGDAMPLAVVTRPAMFRVVVAGLVAPAIVLAKLRAVRVSVVARLVLRVDERLRIRGHE